MNRRIAIGVLAAGVAALGVWLLLRRHDRAKPAQGKTAHGPGARASVDPAPPPSAAPIWFVQRGVAGRKIAGRVVFAGKPLAGAAVALHDQLWRPGQPGAGVDVVSDAAGQFDFGARLAQRYLVVASAPGKTAATETVDLRDPTAKPPADQLELELGACDNALYGTINDSSGGVIAGAHVVRVQDGMAGAWADSDAKGHYELCLPSGRSGVAVGADGYGTIVTAASAHGRKQKDFALMPEATIAGTAVRLEDGAPVPGALVSLESGEGFRRRGALATTVTEADGQFRFSGVGAGRLRVSASADQLATADPVDVMAEAGRTTQVTLRLRGVSRITGVVVASGKPVAGASISAGLPGTARSSTTAVTQVDGSFVLEHVPHGAVAFEVEDHEVLTPKSLTVSQPELVKVQVEVAVEASIAGHVLRSGVPVAGADVLTGGRGGGYSEDTSAADGSYTLSGLPAGSYQVSADSDRAGASGVAGPVALAKGEQKTGVDINLSDAASISGVVVEDSGAPVAGANVRFMLMEARDFGSDETAADGSFHAAGLSGGGSYRVMLSMGFGISGRLQPADPSGFPAVPVADQTTQVTGLRLVVHRGHNVIAGTVVDGSGAAVPDVRVSASRASGGGGRFGGAGGGFGGFGGAGFGGGGPTDLTAITGTDGAFNFADLDDGSYTLQASAGDGASATVNDVSAGSKDVKVTLEAAGGIDGTLSGFQNPPDVAIARADRFGVQNHPQVDDNAFHARGLMAGVYTVTASNDSEGDSVKVEVQSGQVATVTLTNHGTSQVTGHVADWKTHAPAVGLTCQFALGSGRGAQMVPGISTSDASGNFSQTVPSGASFVSCTGNDGWATGVAPLALTGGAPATVEVPTVARRPGGGLANLGAFWDPLMIFVAHALGVRPGTPAGKAGLKVGDTVVSVDGAAVAGLGRAAVDTLIRDRAPGSAVKLGLQRGTQTLDVEVTLDPASR